MSASSRVHFCRYLFRNVSGAFSAAQYFVPFRLYVRKYLSPTPIYSTKWHQTEMFIGFECQNAKNALTRKCLCIARASVSQRGFVALSLRSITRRFYQYLKNDSWTNWKLLYYLTYLYHHVHDTNSSAQPPLKSRLMLFQRHWRPYVPHSIRTHVTACILLVVFKRISSTWQRILHAWMQSQGPMEERIQHYSFCLD